MRRNITTLAKLYEQWLALQPLPPRKQNQLNLRFTVEYNYNSNHLEGNTLTYGQTELLLLFGSTSGEAEMRQFEEMKASNVGLQMVIREAQEQRPLAQTFIRNLHKTLLREDYVVVQNMPSGVQSSYTIHAGQYKCRPNSVITRYGDRFDYASPEETPALMADLVDWYNQAENAGNYSPVELAALFHYRYIRIHPFEDGNGRIARLMVNYILLRHHWPMIVVRCRKKQEYLDALHRTDLEIGPLPSDGVHASLSQIRYFMHCFTSLVYDEIQANIDFCQSSSVDSWWFDGELIHFRSSNTAKILLRLRENAFVTCADISKLLGIHTSAVQKQINSLLEKGYIQRREKDGSWLVFITPTT